MPNQTLDLSNVIAVSILSTPTDLTLQNINTAALFSKETPGNSEVFGIYTNATDVATNYGSSSNAAKIAAAFFAQNPNPIGTQGYLVIIPLTSGGAEKVEDAIARTLNSVYYFGVLVDQNYHGNDSDLTALATYLQSIDKVGFISSSSAADYAEGAIFDLLMEAGDTHTRCLYYHDGTEIDSRLMAAAYAGRALSTDFSGSKTTSTMQYKTLATIVPDQTVNQTALVALQVAGVDAYVSVAGVPVVYTSGKNAWWDEVYNEFWLKFALQTAGFNYLKDTNTKIPQTEIGMEGLKNVFRQVLDQGVSNGFIAPGTWTGDTFGDPESLRRNVASIGYYVYSSPIATQSEANRTARKAPLVQIAVKAAGAIHTASVIVNVNL